MTDEEIRAYAIEKLGENARDALYANVIYPGTASLVPFGQMGVLKLQRCGNDGPFVIVSIPFGVTLEGEK